MIKEIVENQNKIQIIQIIRAISIILVLIFHMGLPLNSGFLGVDIFFFISGLVVSKMIVEKYYAKSIPLFKFYKNRFFRLYPTLIATIFFTIFLSLMLQSSSEIMQIIRNSIYSLLGIVNNQYYLNSSIYGTSATDNNPLLHLWSLSVEFQFYLFYPIILFLLLKFANKRTADIVIIGNLVLLVFQVIVITKPNLLHGVANPNMFLFYLLPFRLYEFSSGAATYFLIKKYSVQWNSKSKSITLLSIIPIIWILLSTSFTDSSKFFNTWTLMIFLSIAVLFSQNISNSKRIIAIKLESFGGYAYSIYLIHLPLITLVHIKYPENAYIPVLMGVVSIFIGILISHYIEIPFMKKKTIVVSYALGILVIILVGLNQILIGFNSRNNVGEVFTQESAKYFRTGRCDDAAMIGSRFCEWNTENSRSVVVVGDSQATFALDGIIPAASVNNLKVVSAARLGCPFMANTYFLDANEKCFKIREKVWNYLQSNRPDFVIISNLSTGYLKSSRTTFSNLDGKCPEINGLGCKGYEGAIRDTVNKLESMNIKVILIQTIPNFVGEYDRDFFDLNPKLNTSKDDLSRTRFPTYISEKNIANNTGLILIDPFEVLCSTSECPLSKNGNFLYANEFHLSTWGALQLTPQLSAAFKSM